MRYFDTYEELQEQYQQTLKENDKLQKENERLKRENIKLAILNKNSGLIIIEEELKKLNK